MRYSVGGVSDMQMVERWCGGIGVGECKMVRS